MSEAINKQDLVKGDPFGEIQRDIAGASAELDRFDQNLREVAKTLSKDLSAASRKTLQDLEKVNAAEIESEKLLKQKIATQQAQTKLLIEEEKLKQAALRTAKAENATKEKTLSLYQQESRKLNDLRNAYKNLAVQNKGNTKEAKALLAQIVPLDAKLKAIDQTVGQSQRNVGNYGNALGSLKLKFSQLAGVASQFGLAIGGGQLLRDGIQTVKEFETQVADLSAVTGLSGKSLDDLKTKAIDFSKKYGESAASIAEGFKLAGSARPELLKDGAAMADLTEKAILLSKASGDDVPTSIANLTGTLNAFEEPASKAAKMTDILANAAQLGAKEIPYLTEAFTKFGAIAKSQNISVAESAAAVELLGQKMPDAASAGTGLRNVMLKLMAPDALGKDAIGRLKALGVNFSQLSDKTIPFSDRLAALKPLLKDNGALVKVFGSENAVAAQILLSQTDQLKKFTGELDKNGTTLEQANIKSNTLSEAGKRLKETWNGYVLELVNGQGAAQGMTATLDFMAKNFDTIVTVVGKLIKLWIAYKAVTAALKLKENYSLWQQNKKAIAESGEALKEGASSAKAFGSAMKAIGISIAIELALELATAFYDVASGAYAARIQMEMLQKANEKAEKNVSAVTQRTKEWVDEQKRLLDLEIRERKAKGENDKKLDKEQLQRGKEIEKQGLNRIKYAQKIRKEEYTNTIAEIERYKQAREKLGGTLGKQSKRELQLIENATRLTKEIVDLNTAEKEFTDLMDESTVAIVENSAMNFKATKVIKEKKREMQSANDEIERMIRLLETTQSLADEIGLYEAEANVQSAIEAQMESINQSGQYSIDLIKQRIEEEYNLQKAIIERIYLEELDAATNEQEVINAQKRRDFELGKLEEQKADKTKEVLKDLETAQEDYADKNKNAVESEKKLAEDRYNIIKGFQEAITQLLTDQIDKRIELMKKEEDAARNRQAYLEQLAANGNITAKESISEQIEIQREAQAEQARLERMKQNVELISAGLGTFNSQLNAGKSPAEALATTLASTQVLVGFLKNLNFFAKGTDNAPGGLAVVDEQGAEIITDKHGRIKDVGSNKGARFTMLDKGDKVITAQKTAKILSAFSGADNAAAMSRVKDSAGNSYDLMAIERLERIEKAIKASATKTDIHWDSLGAIQRTQKNGNTTTNRFRLKS